MYETHIFLPPRLAANSLVVDLNSCLHLPTRISFSHLLLNVATVPTGANLVYDIQVPY